jgi:hypothetical protein
MRRLRLVLLGVLVALSLVAVAAWVVLSVLGREESPEAPLFSLHDGGTFWSCESALILVDALAVEPAGDPGDLGVGPAGAWEIAREVVGEHFDLDEVAFEGTYRSAARLVWVELPDDSRRLAWGLVVVLNWLMVDTYDGGNAVLAYLEADSGQPLALVSGLTLVDAPMAGDCLFNLSEGLDLPIWQTVLLYALLGALALTLVLAVITAVRRFSRRRKGWIT